jgi:hypothetical protein
MLLPRLRCCCRHLAPRSAVPLQPAVTPPSTTHYPAAGYTVCATTRRRKLHALHMTMQQAEGHGLRRYSPAAMAHDHEPSVCRSHRAIAQEVTAFTPAACT